MKLEQSRAFWDIYAIQLQHTLSMNDWMEQATIIPSPNCDERPDPIGISLLVIHSISLPPDKFEEDYVEQFFTNQLDSSVDPYFKKICNLKVSAHLYIRRDGSVVQFVPLNRRAWHAGVSEWEGRKACNDYSIGIELAGSDLQPFADEQYQSLAQLTLEILRKYPKITLDRVVGHSDIAPGRKTDPGPFFDWKRFKEQLNLGS